MTSEGRTVHRRAKRLVAVALGVLAGCHHAAKPASPPPPDGAQPVSVGYGSQSRSESNMSVSTVDSTSLHGQSFTTWEQLIVGRVPGLEVVRTPGGLQLKIRGASTMLASSDPLVIVDGVELGGTSDLLVTVRPSDVARIEVLKDAGSTAIYGSKGANGVILVTLKKHGG